MVTSFSGIDGAGKTTQINLLVDYCEKNGISYTKKWSKARGTPGIMFMKKLVRRDKKMETDEKRAYRDRIYKNSFKRELLFVASLCDLVWYWGIYYRIIQHKYDIMILDRYIWDTYVELSTEFNKKELHKNFLWKIVKSVALKPGKAILLEISAEESLRRDLLKGEITTDELQVKKDKISKYMFLKEKNAWNVVIDSTKGINETFLQIRLALGI